MNEYRLRGGWLVFIYITIPLLIIVFAGIVLIPLLAGSDEQPSRIFYWILGPICFAIVALLIAALIDAIKGKFVIENDRVVASGVFENGQLLYTEIRGYSLTEHYIFIEPINANRKRLKVSRYYHSSYNVITWLSQRYPDLDLFSVEEEERTILREEEFGWNVEQRESKLKNARLTSKILNWIGGVAGVWILFWPHPYEYALIVSLVLPVIILFVIRTFNGLIRLSEGNEKSAFPSLFIALVSPCLSIVLRALFDFDVFDFKDVWQPVIIITVFFLTVTLTRNKEFSFRKAKDYFVTLTLSMLFFGYGYGAVINLNCYYDQSDPRVFTASVLSKRETSGDPTYYYLRLSPWGPRKEIEEVSVKKKMFDVLTISDEVNIYYGKGRFNIPWYYLKKAEK